MCIYSTCPFNKCVFFTIKQGFYKQLNYFLCFSVMSMQKRTSFCVVMTIIDSQLYIIDSLSLDVSFE